MTHQQSELRSLVAYQLAKRGEEYNSVVIYDTVNVLYRRHSSYELKAMINNEHADFPAIEDAIKDILDDTYSTVNQ